MIHLIQIGRRFLHLETTLRHSPFSGARPAMRFVHFLACWVADLAPSRVWCASQYHVIVVMCRYQPHAYYKVWQDWSILYSHYKIVHITHPLVNDWTSPFHKWSSGPFIHSKQAKHSWMSTPRPSMRCVPAALLWRQGNKKGPALKSTILMKVSVRDKMSLDFLGDSKVIQSPNYLLVMTVT